MIRLIHRSQFVIINKSMKMHPISDTQCLSQRLERRFEITIANNVQLCINLFFDQMFEGLNLKMQSFSCDESADCQ